MTSSIEEIQYPFHNRKVTAHRLRVTSSLPIDLDSAWEKVQTSDLLVFITKGRVKFKPTGGEFPKIWKEGSVVTTKMLVYGFIPFGGLHTLKFEKKDQKNKVLQTKEWDKGAKIWNHTISLKKKDEKSVEYTDEVIIYGGILTGIISFWARSFYKYRQKRWRILAERFQASGNK